jgi:hypothetical protein
MVQIRNFWVRSNSVRGGLSWKTTDGSELQDCNMLRRDDEYAETRCEAAWRQFPSFIKTIAKLSKNTFTKFGTAHETLC